MPKRKYGRFEANPRLMERSQAKKSGGAGM